MNIALFILVGFSLMSLGVSMANHGRVENRKENFWISFIACAIHLTLLYFAVNYK